MLVGFLMFDSPVLCEPGKNLLNSQTANLRGYSLRLRVKIEECELICHMALIRTPNIKADDSTRDLERIDVARKLMIRRPTRS